jgi:hypothetical protein
MLVVTAAHHKHPARAGDDRNRHDEPLLERRRVGQRGQLHLTRERRKSGGEPTPLLGLGQPSGQQVHAVRLPRQRDVHLGGVRGEGDAAVPGDPQQYRRASKHMPGWCRSDSSCRTRSEKLGSCLRRLSEDEGVAEHDDNPEPAAVPRVIDRLRAAGLSDERIQRYLGAGAIRLDGQVVTDLEQPAPPPAARERPRHLEWAATARRLSRTVR